MTDSTASPIVLYQGATEYFPALVAAIDSAHRSVYVESYLISDDAPTQTVLQALARARSRGVRVFLLLDGFGAAAQVDWVRAQLEPQGIEVQVYRPGFRWLAPHTWRRLHRKLVLVDERLGFVGGINLISDQFDLKHGHLARPRLDFAARVSAARAVAAMSWSMRKLWWRVSLRNAFQGSMRSLFDADHRPIEIRRVRRIWRRVRTHLRWRAAPSRRDASRKVRLLFRDNFRHRRSIENWYLQRIHQARREILLGNAYFVPTLVFRQALISAAQRGVQVRLLLQGASDQWWTQWVTQALTDELLAAGIEIFEYQPSFLHAKVAVIDDWITVGSSNIDPFSLMMSLESNLVAEDSRSAANLRDRLEAALADSTPRQGISRTPGRRRGLIRLLSLTFALMALRVFLAFTGSRFRVT